MGKRKRSIDKPIDKLSESKCPECGVKIWKRENGKLYQHDDWDIEHVHVPATATSETPDAANRASEIGAMGVKNEAAQAFDAELSADDATEISAEEWQRIHENDARARDKYGDLLEDRI
jgi:hypothetical protein